MARFKAIGRTVFDTLEDAAWEASGAEHTSYVASSESGAILLAASFNDLVGEDDDFVSVFDCVNGNCHVCEDGLKGL